ncbi:hypothetical protein CYLTODRAFT_417104 [Cylindrobasidium torrendii FP15055 ss-10]|uniref:PHD-type domain-containing protein n=1 Tax=Cylindrobasidium torrendii FP15055 ss-10 TaxID=1314674 RepID=A0A0D7BTD2_9AGAR|nr:hypothetical protein CYLTODRAFT_417104 [Cylindrobasidium torrendii FP15055 ss-10]
MAASTKTSKAAKPATSSTPPPNTIDRDQRMATYYSNIPPLTSRHPSLPQPITPKVSSPGNSTTASITASSSSSDVERDSIVKREGDEHDEDSSDKKYCYCESEGDGEMIGCDGAACHREWFHLSCLKMSRAPKGAWFCKECRLSR